MDVRLGAEAPAAHADAVLVPEDGGDQPGVPAVDGERRSRRALPRAAEHRDARQRGQPRSGVAGELLLVGGDLRRARCRRAAAPPRRRRWHPSRFGLPASPRSGRSAHTTSSRVTARTVPPPQQSGSPPNSRRSPISAPEPYGAYSLCADTAMASRWPGSSWSSMSIWRCPASCAASTRILPPDGVDLGGEPMDRWSHAGHVGRPGHRQQGDPVAVASQLVIEIVLVQRAVDPCPDVDDGCPLRATAAGWSGARGPWSARRRPPAGPSSGRTG